MGRAILLDSNPAVKQIAWLQHDNPDGTTIRRSVEVDQNQAIELKATPRVTYYFLIARLNTDMKGKVVGDDIVIEYLQLSSQVYEDFCDSAEELDGFSSIQLKKVVRKPGDTFGYVKPTASQYQVPDAIFEKINKMKANKEFIKSLWQLVDVASSITFDDWKKLVKETPSTKSQTRELPPAPNSILPSPEEVNDFNGVDDFSSDSDFDR